MTKLKRVMLSYLYLILCWGVYFFLHSFLASDTFLTVRKKRIFRILYNLFSALGLMVLLFVNAVIDGGKYFGSTGMIRYVSFALAAFGVIIIRQAFKQFPLSEFSGMKHERRELKTGGILQYVRHPVYCGIILITAGYFLFSPDTATLISACCVFAHLLIGIPREERKLTEIYGDAYRRYRERVPMLIPRIGPFPS